MTLKQDEASEIDSLSSFHSSLSKTIPSHFGKELFEIVLQWMGDAQKRKSNMDTIFYLLPNLSILQEGYSEINALAFHFGT